MQNIAGPSNGIPYRGAEPMFHNYSQFERPVGVRKQYNCYGVAGGIQPDWDNDGFPKDSSPLRGHEWFRHNDVPVRGRSENISDEASPQWRRFEETPSFPAPPNTLSPFENASVTEGRMSRVLDIQADYFTSSRPVVDNNANDKYFRSDQPSRRSYFMDEKSYFPENRASEDSRSQFNHEQHFVDDDPEKRFHLRGPPLREPLRAHNAGIPFDEKGSRKRFPSPELHSRDSRPYFDSERPFDDCVPRERLPSAGPSFRDFSHSDFNPKRPYDDEGPRVRFPSSGLHLREVPILRFNPGRSFDDVAPRERIPSPVTPFGEVSSPHSNSVRPLFEGDITREQYVMAERETAGGSGPRPLMNWISPPRSRFTANRTDNTQDDRHFQVPYEQCSRSREDLRIAQYEELNRQLETASPSLEESRSRQYTSPRLNNDSYSRYASEFENNWGRSRFDDYSRDRLSSTFSPQTPSFSRSHMATEEQHHSIQNRIVIAHKERPSAFERLGPHIPGIAPNVSASDFVAVRIRKEDHSEITKENAKIINNEIEDMILQDSAAYFNLLRFDRAFLTKKKTAYICICENKITADWLLDKTLPYLSGKRLIVEKDDAFEDRAMLFTDISHCFRTPIQIIDLLKKNNDLSKVDVNDWKVTKFRSSSRNTHICFSIKQKDSMYIKSFFQSRFKVLDNKRPMRWKTKLLRKDRPKGTRHNRRGRIRRPPTKADFVNL